MKIMRAVVILLGLLVAGCGVEPLESKTGVVSGVAYRSFDGEILVGPVKDMDVHFSNGDNLILKAPPTIELGKKYRFIFDKNHVIKGVEKLQ